MGKETAVLERFKAARLYVVTAPPVRFADYEPMVRAICQGGADVVQFRDKQMSRKGRYELAAKLRAICTAHQVLFIVNDDLEVALASGADGVHLGQEDMPTGMAKEIIHHMGVGNFLIGRSTHSLDQALKAQDQGVDYIGIGPVYATPTKAAYVPVGLSLVKLVTSQVRTPHVAIGGIDAGNVGQVLDAGADRVAVVRAVCGAVNVMKAAQQMKDLILSSPAVSGRGSMMDSPLTAAGNDIQRVR